MRRFLAVNLNVATVTNGLIDVAGAGTVTITASQVGNYKYLSAPAVARTFTVTSAASARTAATPLATKTAASPADIELFPNPAHSEVSLVLPAALHAVPLRTTVLNVLGQAVLQRTLPGGAGQRTLPLEGLAKGVYIVRIESAGGSTSKRLLHE